MGREDSQEASAQAQDSGMFDKMRKHAKEFVEASPEEHGK